MAHTSTLDSTNALTTLAHVKDHLGIDPGTAQIVQVNCQQEDAGGGINNEYFLFSSTVDDYYVWYNVAAGGSDPSVSGRTAIVVAVANSATATVVATATAAAITAVTGVTSTSSGSTVTITNDSAGYVLDPDDGTTPFTVTQAVVGGNDDVSQDVILTDYINEASIWFNDQTDRQLKSRSQTEYHDSQGQWFLYLNHPPISAVTLYEDFSIPRAWAAASEVDSDYYEVWTEDNIGKLDLTGYVFGFDRRSIKVTYTGGFSTIPTDLERAVFLWIAQASGLKDLDGYVVTSQDRRESNITINRDPNKYIETMIHKYRRWGAIV